MGHPVHPAVTTTNNVITGPFVVVPYCVLFYSQIHNNVELSFRNVKYKQLAY